MVTVVGSVLSCWDSGGKFPLPTPSSQGHSHPRGQTLPGGMRLRPQIQRYRHIKQCPLGENGMGTGARTCCDALPKAVIARGHGHNGIVQSATVLGCPCPTNTRTSRRAKGSRPASTISEFQVSVS